MSVGSSFFNRLSNFQQSAQQNNKTEDQSTQSTIVTNSKNSEKGREDLSGVEEDDIWMDTLEHENSITSESSSNSVYVKERTTPYQQFWDRQEITFALSKLPAGEAALAVIPTLVGEKLETVIQEAEKLALKDTSTPRDSLCVFSQFTNSKKVMSEAENEAAVVVTPSKLLTKWPNTCLLIASWFEKSDLVATLLKKGARVSYRDCEGRTALHLAAGIGSVRVVNELLKYGANPNDWDFNKKLTPLHCAAAAANTAAVQCLIESGANVNAGLSGKSPLHYAVLSNAYNCVEALLKAGASPNNPQVFTETPLHVAASLGSAECLRLLLDYGADVRVQYGQTRSTALHLAAEEGSPECVKLLLEAGAACNAVNYRGQSAVHLAALAQSSETVEILISHNANVDMEDNDGRTALHAAVAKATRDCETLVKLLIQASRKLINKADKFGYTPLHIAALNENSTIVILLFTKGADVTARTKGGVSALSFITRRTPDVLPRFVARLDQAISLHDHELGDVDCELKLDFKPLLSGSGRGETDLMLCLVEVGQRHILKHPLCESFLYLKWLKIRKFFIMSLVFHSIFVAAFTTYVTVTFLWESENISNALFWPVITLTFVLVCKEFFQLAHSFRTYAKGWENVLQWSVISASGLVSLIRPMSDWQHHVAALGILLAWIELMMVVGRFPMFGIYVQMFTQVSINFFKFLSAYLCLIIGFSLGFAVLHRNYKSFQNPLIGLLKTIIMMSGELEFEDVFFDENMPLLYSGTAHLMLLAFVILVTVILTNLMVGLAVSDIQELRRCAGLDRLIRRAELVAHLESLLFSKLLDYAPKKIIEPCRNGALLLRLPHYCAINVRPNDPREKRLPKELIKSIYRLVIEKKNRNKIMCSTVNTKQCFGVNNINECTSNNSTKIKRIYSTNSYTNDHTQKHIRKLAAELARCSQNISMHLEALTNKVEFITHELDIKNQ